MKKITRYSVFLLLIIIPILLLETACSSRIEVPQIEADSTIVYPPKKTDDISAKITFCREINNKTGEPTGVGAKFVLQENKWLRAVIDFNNRYAYGNQELLFHIDWVDPDGKSMFRRQISLMANDSTSTLNSSISISPESREPGDYSLRFYLFRELIAEKEFEILPQFTNSNFEGKGINPNIVLYRYNSKKTGKRIGEGAEFAIKKKAKVRAFIELENRFAFDDLELLFKLDWIGPDGKSFYDKEINLDANDSTTILNSSISITPDKREAGEYIIRLYLYDKLVGEQKFGLIVKK